MLSYEEIAEQYAKHKDWWDFARAVERATIERCEESLRVAAKCDCGHPCDCFDLAVALGAIRAMLEEKP